MHKTQIVTYESTTGETLSVTPEQERRLLAAGRWPKDRNGTDFVNVRAGLHYGMPSYTEAEIAEMCQAG